MYYGIIQRTKPLKKYWDNVKIILEEREVEESNWNNKNIGETKWTGKL